MHLYIATNILLNIYMYCTYPCTYLYTMYVYVYMRNMKQVYQTALSENSNGTELNKRYGEIMDKPAAGATHIHIVTKAEYICICII